MTGVQTCALPISLPAVSPGNDSTFCYGGIYTLNAGPGFSGYEWNTGETTQQIDVDTTGEYFVRIEDANGCISNSDTVNVLVKVPYPGQEICIVLVDSSTNENLVVWEKPVGENIDSFRIYRETHITDDFELIGTVAYADLSQFEDTASNPKVQSERYTISVLDSCGNESALSTPHKTLHLGIAVGVPSGFELNWVDEYEGFTFSTYRIYRKTDVSDWLAIDSIAQGNVSYTDLAPPTGEGDVYYFVAAVKPGGACTPAAGKASSGPFSQSLSNMEDNGIISEIASISAPDIIVYPNPLTDKTIIRFDNTGNKPYQLRITDLSGKEVQTMDNITTGKIEINRGSLQQGCYMIELKGEKVFRSKLIVE